MGRRHVRVPDRGRDRRGRSGRLRLGRVLPRAGPGPQRRHRRVGRRPLPPLPVRPRPDARVWGCTATGSPSPGRASCPTGPGRSTSAGSTSTGASSTGCASAASRRWRPCSTGTCRRRCRTRAVGSPATSRYRFADYAAAVYAALGDDIPTWLTINEPKTVVQNGYLYGHPRARSDRPRRGLRGRAPPRAGARPGACRRSGPAAPAGSGPRSTCTRPTRPTTATAPGPRPHCYDGYENRLYLDPVLRGQLPRGRAGRPRRRTAGWPRPSATATSTSSRPRSTCSRCSTTARSTSTPTGETVNRWPTSQAFWQQIYPEGMYDILTRVTRDYGAMPISITENGLPCPDELGRGRHRRRPRPGSRSCATTSPPRTGPSPTGVPLESYHVWSLLDNFEWQQGYAERWGLVYVDYATQRRILKRSAHWYRDVIARNGICRGLTRGKEGARVGGLSHWGRGRERGLPRPPAPDPAPATVRWPGSSRRLST